MKPVPPVTSDDKRLLETYVNNKTTKFYLLGHEGSRTNGLIIGSFLLLSAFSLSDSSFDCLSVLSKLKAKLEPAKRLDFEAPKCEDSFG